MSDNLISEAELLQRAVLSPNSEHAITVWLTAKSTRVPTALRQKCMQKGKHERIKEQRDSEALLQVGRERNLDFSTIKGYAKQRIVGNRENRTVVDTVALNKVLNSPKSDRNQLILLFANDAGFRSGEISSFNRDWCDPDTGDLYVLDSKKGQLFPAFPSARLIHAIDDYRERYGIDSGLLIRGRKHSRKLGSKSRGEGMTEHSLTHICYQCCDAVHVPRVPLRYFRAKFALDLLAKNGEVWDGSPLSMYSVVELMFWMRHVNPEDTMDYLRTIVDYQLFKKRALNRELKAVCQDVCQHAGSCRGFQPQTIKETTSP